MTKLYTTWRVIIGCALRRARKSAGLSQGAVAEKMGLSQSALSRIESGRSSISADRLAEVVIALGNPSQINVPDKLLESRLRQHGIGVLIDHDPQMTTLVSSNVIYGLLYP